MLRLRKILFPLVLIACALLAFNQVGAISIRELLGLDNDEDKTGESAATETVIDGQNWARQDQAQSQQSLTFEDIQKVLANVNASQKGAVLKNAETFKQFVQQEANNQSVLTAARTNKVDDDDNTRFLMQRSAENILRETYLSKLITGKLPAGFPTEEQIREYYDKNEDSFFMGERVHVWQIFLRIESDMTKEQVTAIQQRIKNIRKDVIDKKVDFADAALQYSDHGPSKASGGYMGLVKVAELKPELSGTLLNLPEGELSEPITTDTGLHILKRGAIVPKQDVSFEQIKNQIRERLLQQATTQLRQAVYNQAAKTYPIDLTDEAIETWRQQLLK